MFETGLALKINPKHVFLSSKLAKPTFLDFFFIGGKGCRDICHVSWLVVAFQPCIAGMYYYLCHENALGALAIKYVKGTALWPGPKSTRFNSWSENHMSRLVAIFATWLLGECEKTLFLSICWMHSFKALVCSFGKNICGHFCSKSVFQHTSNT